MDKIAAHFLQWENERTGKRCPAGVAFYSDKYDEFRLKIDCFPENQFTSRLLVCTVNEWTTELKS